MSSISRRSEQSRRNRIIIIIIRAIITTAFDAKDGWSQLSRRRELADPLKRRFGETLVPFVF